MRRAAVVLIAVAFTLFGVYGAYGYANDYNLHRGFTTLEQLPRAGTGRLESVRFYSTALHRPADYLVYLPPGYHAGRRYPVYYLLHGMPGQPKVFIDIANMDVRLDNQISLGRARPMILVYPDGRIGGSVFSDSEWANTAAGDFESYVMEVVNQVDNHFAALPYRSDRVIAGFSSGAYGAVNIALHHLSTFGSVQSWSGYYAQTRSGVFAHGTPAALADNSPVNYVGRLGRALAREPVRVYMFVGRADGSAPQQLPMDRRLRAAGADVRYAVYSGGHDWAVWYPRLNAMLDLASRDVSYPLAPRRLIARRRRSAVGHARLAPGLPRVPDAATVAPTRPAGPTVRPVPRRHRSAWRLIGALLLALVSSALINLGFVLQHRGHVRTRARSIAAVLASRSWLAGQALGWIGFAGSVVALALAPLTLIQAFAAGSLALSVPIAARLFGARVSRTQLAAVAVIALSLVSLPIGFAGGHHAQLRPGALLGASLAVLFGALALHRVRRTAASAIASGALYGIADAAIKADAIALHHHGLSGLLSGWTILAGLATFGGFLAFQAALRGHDAVQPLTLMNAFTAVTAVLLGVGAFGERLGSSTAADVAHGAAIVLVLACVRPLAAAHERISQAAPAGEPVSGDGPRGGRPAGVGGAGQTAAPRRAWGVVRGAASAGGRGMIVVVMTLVGCLSGLGLLYTLRGAHALAFGPPVADALPLLQLAGFAGQPLARVIVAWLVAGLCVGAILHRVSPSRRLALVAAFGALVLLVASDASYALAHNVGFGPTMLHREPGLGPWLQCLLLAGASVIAWPAAGSVALARRSALGRAVSRSPRPVSTS